MLKECRALGYPSSSWVSKFLTSEAEKETSKSCYRQRGRASGQTAAEMFNSKVLSLVSAPVTSPSDLQATRRGGLGVFSPVYEIEENQRCLPFSFLTKATYGGPRRSVGQGTQGSGVCHKHLSCNSLLVFHLKVSL